MRSYLGGLQDKKSSVKAITGLLHNEELRSVISGPDGYRWVATLFCQGSMAKVFLLMSALCKAGELNFNQLQWGAQFQGATQQFAAPRAEVRKGFNDIENFTCRSVNGEKKFAQDFCRYDLAKAERIMPVICSAERRDFSLLGWKLKRSSKILARSAVGLGDRSSFMAGIIGPPSQSLREPDSV